VVPKGEGAALPAALLVPGVEGDFLGDGPPARIMHKQDSWCVAACMTARVEGGVVGDAPPARIMLKHDSVEI